ncbi:HigA family addiction module antitoxin [Stutzerimonas kunmingensis]|uniref:HigA family addiction module antidote protein n=1 Tax=Stutzerimonas kunmingensis TaxID=1211807 RepID=A0A2N8S8J6_9GAMM|nr:HigA family addiction module antitoxin [Stutzerimonas kunmingensis]MCD1606736.1 HigA family addiction module antidote protein [Stutzerimonas kunmingensis]MCQ2044861.1 HigA family addiction module antitoxin [Stutzerimonas kunmingensis]PNF98816.1 addiction module antidote protein, HigA family [Stutzerimonas kunmingensis]SFJ80983.1 addiction module antidote protein, HigA family [Stutzerimonas kunmingensis]
MAINGMRPIHPGEVLREEFLEPLGITPAALARALHVSAPTINDIVRERRGITADTAIRLGRYFDTSAQFWMNLQTEYALATTYAEAGEEIEHEIEPLRAVG